jgi:pimeloyl-ACP methyl ester carboxylesterase
MHYVEATPSLGKETQTLVFLHGFPEAWFAWKNQIKHFSKLYRVIAPDLPGYNLSEKIRNVSFYQVPNLIAIIKEFVDAIANGQKVILIAHDWGGAIAWPLAAFHSELFSKLIILNAAHPSTFTREMINNVEQRRRSDYIHQLIDDDAVVKLKENNFSYLQKTIWESMSSSGLTSGDKEQYITAWGEEGALACMLNYYKAMPQLAPSVTSSERRVSEVTQKMTIPNIRVQLQTLVLWGEQDKAFVVNVLDDLNTYVPDLEIKRFRSATHWLHHEIPVEVNQAIEDWLKVNRF